MADELTPLSDREKELLQLVATGATNQQIARELFISVNTVKVHLKNIYFKLDVGSRTEATMVAVRQGWVEVPRAPGEADEEALVTPPPETAPDQERWSRVSAAKRAGLVLAMLLALVALFLPQMFQSQATGGEPDPVGSVFPTPTALTGSSSGRWHTRAQMPTPRSGLAVAAYDGIIYAIGGVDNDGVTAKVEVYDPEADVWTARSPKPTAVGFVSAAVVGSKIYVPGGIGVGQQHQNVLEVYVPEKDTWEARAPMPEPLGAYGLAVLDDRLYLFGGSDGQDYVTSSYQYDPETDRWEALQPLAQARGFLSATALGDRIYVVGGYDGETEYDTCDVYEPSTDTWIPRSPMDLRRGGLSLVAVRENLYAIGGGMDDYMAFNERYDPKVDVWSRFETPVTEQWWGLGAAFVSPHIYAIGGRSGSNLSVNEAYQALFYQVIILP